MGQSYATTITVSNAPTKPTVSVSMAMKSDGGTIKYQMGDVGKSEPVSAGNNTWTFKVWPANWYQATGGDGGGRPALVPGYYCQGTATVRLNSGNTATVQISGNVFNDIMNWGVRNPDPLPYQVVLNQNPRE